MREAPNIPSRPQSASTPPAPDGNNQGTNRRRNTRLTDRIMPPEQRSQPTSFTQRVLVPYAERMVAPGTWLWNNFQADEVRVKLLRAGFPYGLRAHTFIALKIGSTIVSALMMALYSFIFAIILANYEITFTTTGSIIFMFICAFVGAIYGFRLPDIWLSIQIRKRQQAIQLVLPDMIDLISVSVEAGLGLMMAIQRISDRFDNPLSEEFLRTLQEVRLGRPQADALRDMTRRVDVSDLTTLLTAIIQAELLGLAVSNVLRVQSERLRERRSQRAREAAQKAPIKMTFPLVLFIFPTLFIIIMGPAIIKIFLQQVSF